MPETVQGGGPNSASPTSRTLQGRLAFGVWGFPEASKRVKTGSASAVQMPVGKAFPYIPALRETKRD